MTTSGFQDFPRISQAYKHLCTVCSLPLLDHTRCDACGVLIGEQHLDKSLKGVHALVKPRNHVKGHAPVGMGLNVCQSCGRTVKAGRVLRL